MFQCQSPVRLYAYLFNIREIGKSHDRVQNALMRHATDSSVAHHVTDTGVRPIARIK